MDWSHVLCRIFIFFCSFSWLAPSYKVLFFSSCHLLVYDENQCKLKPSTVIYKMQLLYTTHSKTPVVYMLRHNLCHLPLERYWSYSVNILQKGCWMRAQGNMWLLALIYNLINNDLFVELCSLLHCFLWLNLLSLTIAPADLRQRPSLPRCPSGSLWSLWSPPKEPQEKAETTWQIWLLFFKWLAIFADPESGDCSQHGLHPFCGGIQFLVSCWV